MSTLTESCACGATFTATANYMSDMRQQAEAFRDAHQRCRETGGSTPLADRQPTPSAQKDTAS